MLFQEIETAKVTQQFQKSNPLIRKFAKNKPKIRQLLNKTSPIISNPQVTKKKPQIQKKQAQIRRKNARLATMVLSPIVRIPIGR